MKVLVVGSGAREHAIVQKCIESEMADKEVFCAPGNAGIGMIAECVDIKADNIEALAVFAKKQNIELTIVGPEVPLVMGIVDLFKKEERYILGPSKLAAAVEGSKLFAKSVLGLSGLSNATASYKPFVSSEKAKEYIQEHSMPVVIKAKGLASGKGVVVAKSVEEAEEAVDRLADLEFGWPILVEEYLAGWECSFTVLADGKNIIPFPVSCDYKQDLSGKNTGGLGAYSPVPRLTEEHYNEILGYTRRFLEKLCDIGIPYTGFLYPGIIVTSNGPKILEFNCRLGDPEAQVILPRLESDFVKLCYDTAKGELSEEENILWSPDAFVGIVLASPGYPDKPEVGDRIYGLEEAAKKGALVFHGGTKKNDKEKLVTDGGRVLSIVGRGSDNESARKIAYEAASHISFGNKDSEKGKQWYRKDIALGV